MSFSAQERETTLNINDDHKKWQIYTLMPTIITKLRKAGVNPYKVDSYGGHYYELDFEQVSFRRKSETKRQISDEQRRAAAERLRKARENKNKN